MTLHENGGDELPELAEPEGGTSDAEGPGPDDPVLTSGAELLLPAVPSTAGGVVLPSLRESLATALLLGPTTALLGPTAEAVASSEPSLADTAGSTAGVAVGSGAATLMAAGAGMLPALGASASPCRGRCL